MAVHIRLSRHGTNKAPFYRIVVADQRDPRDGRFIENLGVFDPTTKPKRLEVNRDRLAYWQGQGAQTSATLARVLRRAPAQGA